MKLIKPLIYTLIILFSLQKPLNAQQVNGHWYGVGKVMVSGEHSAYMAELILKQKGKTVSGELQYYFRDSLFKVKVNGLYNNNSRQLTLKPIVFIYYLSKSTSNGIDCILSGNFTLIVNRTESILNGAFESDAAHKYTNPAIQFRFRLSTDTLPGNISPVEEPDTIPDSSITSVDTTPIAITADSIKIDPIYKAREKQFISEIEVSGGPLKLQLYDNGSIDYDSVSVYLNDQILIPKVKLDHKAIRKTITLDSTRTYNEITMFAENLGTIPPNTAALIIYDGEKRHELILTSDLNKSATIKLKRRQ